jgi:DNA helicase II / ATP-dependent DNA helicase PcrA
MEQKKNTRKIASAIDAIFEGLNLAQRRAVDYGIGTEKGTTPPLLIAAGAGTGKTKTLAHRVARLILAGVDPRRLLLLTFTRRAALEMTRRAQQILAASRGARPSAPKQDYCPGRAHFIRSATVYCASTPLPWR